ncbi:formate dehydrogenase subunit delta [Sphingobium nicotianae]|uniref:Formate dehydrogenase subunit delta n=1 Tax=Sphingobium nicotianae TaxID=2782607 RepID=A0A9X1IQY3_9SPHN|nr:formate dehydrogenase subunit delta [Sphingobium nicotianae]MBT2187048.1 formate dehydrogenase subunit delta [Sphingobium nicotianae]
MEIDRLTYMANQIARAFEPQGHDVAVKEAATHINKFWDPRMKKTMLDGDRSGLTPIAAEAMVNVEAYVAAHPASAW